MATLVMYNSQAQAEDAAKQLINRGFKPDEIAVMTPESLHTFLDRMPWWFMFGVIMGGLAGIAAGAVIGYYAPIAFGFEKYVGGIPYQSIIFGGMNGFIAGIMIGGYNGLLGGLWVGESVEKTIKEMGDGHAMLQVSTKTEQDPLVCSMAAETGGSCVVHEVKGPPTAESLWRVVSMTVFTVVGIAVLIGIFLFIESLFYRLHP